MMAVWLFLAISVGIAVLGLSGDFSLGNMIWASIIPMICLTSLIILKIVDSHEIAFSFRWPKISIGQVVIGMVVATVVAYGTIYLGAEWGKTYGLIAMVVGFGFFISLLLFITRDGVQGLVVFMFILPFVQILEESHDLGGSSNIWRVGPLVFTPSLILLLLILVASAANRKTPIRLGLTPIEKYMALLAFFLLLASAASVDPMYSFRAAIPQVLFFPFIYFLVIGRVQQYRHVEVLFYSLMGYALLRLGFIFYFFGRMHGFSVIPSSSMAIHELVSTVVRNAENVTTVAIWAIPLLISLIIRTQSRRWASFLGFGLMFALSLLALIDSGKRGALFALLFTLPILLLYRRLGTKMAALAAVGAIGAAVGAIGYPLLESRFAGLNSWESITRIAPVYQRWDAWLCAARMMLDHPLGVGFGGFARLSWQYSALPDRPMFGVLADPHNWFADLGTSGGIGALASLLALLITVYMLGFRLCRKLKVDRQYVAVGLLWSLSAYLLSSVVASVSAFNDQETPVVGVGILFWISIGLLVALDRIQRREQQESTFSMVVEQSAGRTLSAKR